MCLISFLVPLPFEILYYRCLVLSNFLLTNLKTRNLGSSSAGSVLILFHILNCIVIPFTVGKVGSVDGRC